MTARVEIYRETTSTYEPVEDAATGYLKNRTVDHPNTGKWRWRFVSSNGRIMADGGQGYELRGSCIHGCETVLGGRILWHDGLPISIRRGLGGHETIPVRDLTGQP